MTGQKVWSSLRAASPTGASRSCGPTRRAAAQGHLDAGDPDGRRRASRSARCARSPGRASSTRCSSTRSRSRSSNLIGPEHEGWRVAEHDARQRARRHVRVEGAGAARGGDRAADRRRARPAGCSATRMVRQRLAESWIDVEIFRLHNQRTLARLARGEELGSESSLVKLFWAGMSQRLYETAVAVLGPDALLMPGDDHAVDAAGGCSDSCASRANSIMGGTSEIQRNIIGERLLGLPAGAEGPSDRADRRRRSTSSIPSATRARATRTTLWTRLRAEAPVAYFAPDGLRAVLGDHEARRHPGDLEAAAALLERAGHHAAPGRAWCCRRRRWSSCSTRRGTGRCAGSRTRRFTPRAVRGQARRHRAHRGGDPRRRRRPSGSVGRARLRRAHRARRSRSR